MTDPPISDILAAVKQRESHEQVIQIEENTAQLVVFLLAERYYAFYGESIKEIVPVGDICYVPGMPDYIPGVIHVRGEIESVLDLRKLLHLPCAPPTKRRRILIGHYHQIRSGILVDSVEDVCDMPEETISEPVSSVGTAWEKYIIGEATYKEEELIILDVGNVFKNLLSYDQSS